MLSGSVSVEATPNGRDMLVFSWSATQDETAKTSTVAWVMSLVADEYGALDVTDAEVYPWAVTVDGQAFSGNSNIYIGANETVTLASGEAVLEHEADGTKSFEFTFMQDFEGLTWGDGTVINEVTGTGTGELDAFAVKFDIKGFLTGLAMALCSPARGLPKREPVAFLYNGVQLPALPEWDKGTYPHCYIEGYINADGNWMYYLAATTSECAVHFNSSKDADYVYCLDDIQMYACVFNTGDDNPAWGSFIELDFSAGNPIFPASQAIWADYDLINTDDNSVYLAASDPIPVYE